MSKAIIGEVRFSYANLCTPRVGLMGGDPKYSATILVPKSDVKAKALIDQCISDAITEGVASKFGGTKPATLPTPLHDGDGVRPSDGEPYGDECKGHWMFTASSKEATGIVDVKRQPIMNQSEVYSGMYGFVSVNFYPYNFNGKKGIGCGLNNVMKTRDGEALAGRASADEDFSNVQVPDGYQALKIDPITGEVIYG